MMTIRIDVTEFKKFVKKYNNEDWPNAVVDALTRVINKGRVAGVDQTKTVFNIRSPWVLQGIKGMPSNPSQKASALSALRRHGDCNGKVYIRGAANARNSMEFMADHEEGKTRTPQKRTIAIPTKTLQDKAYRTNTGKVKLRYQPSKLLEHFDRAGVPFNGTTTTLRGHKQLPRNTTVAGDFFIIKGKKSHRPFIVRRFGLGSKAKLQFFYMLADRAEIKKKWKFIKRVRDEFEREITKEFTKAIGSIKGV